MSKPFRYDFSNPDSVRAGPAWVTKGLGRDKYPVEEFLAELRTCAARVIAFSQDTDLGFVGRSPDSIYDYLSGVLADTAGRIGCPC